jgi:glycosyltransferase involved in cell wall biosynthesis
MTATASQQLRVFTFFYNRYTDATTSLALRDNGIDHTVLMHSYEQFVKFQAGGTLAGEPRITGKPKGLAYQRNAALDMMEEGEWAVFMCDDFQQIRSYPIAKIMDRTASINVTIQNQAEHKLRQDKFKMTLKEMFSMFPRLIQIAEANNVKLIGFGLHDNPLNLGRKFTTRGLADGRFWLVQKSTYRFDENVQMVDDVGWTAENLIRHGKVLVLNWTVPYFQRYTAGAFGSIAHRTEQRRKECAYLANKFAPMVRIVPKPNWPLGTHIRLYAGKNAIREARLRNSL